MLILYVFRSHNANVIKKVPKERLLIWNLKDGWEPICKFLNVPIPDEPIPIVNKTTDKMFFDNLFQDKIGKHLPWKAWVHGRPGPLSPHGTVGGTLMKGVLGNDGTYIFLVDFNLPRDTSTNCIFILSKTIFIISELPKKLGKIYFLFVKIKP